jgi:soluble lytic murein transglycosylase-like protein
MAPGKEEHVKTISSNILTNEELDKLFCLNGKKYRLKKLLIKAVAIVESSLDEHSYRFEPAFFQKYLKDKPEWKESDPAIVSASYGLMQIMWTTAWSLGFRGTQEDLWNPIINIELGTKLLRKLLDKIEADNIHKLTQLWPIECALARYNGGSKGNPDEEGKLRNQKYVTRVMKILCELQIKEKDCEDNV